MKAELKSPTKLTPRQAEVLAFIKSYLDETGYPPTRADIARQLGFKSANASEEHLKALARKGAIEMIPGTSRGIKLPESNGIPIVGRSWRRNILKTTASFHPISSNPLQTICLLSTATA